MAALIIMFPGVYGGFYLDDFVNLGGLASAGNGWVESLSYLLNAPVGGSGRPISYLSFILQSGSWPGSPFDFKLANLLIHIINGFLVSWFAWLIGNELTERKEKSLVFVLSALSGFVWTTLPISASSVFYVVQRMTLLSTFFVLVSLVGFCALRQRRHTWNTRDYLAATFIVGVGYFGIFAKEGAITVGLMILATEYAVFSKSRPSLSPRWKFLVLLAPIALVFIYLSLTGKVFNGYGSRDFTLVERLLAQPVIVLDYVGKILLPSNGRINLYNDGFPLKEVLDHHFLVGVAITILVAALLVAFLSKSRLLSFSVLFFLAGHVLESTIIPLELYFEHRNYAPSIGLIIGLVFSIGLLVARIRKADRVFGLLAIMVCGLWIGWSALVSSTEAKTWGNPRDFAIAALTERPNSLRARQEIAAYFSAAGEYMGAANLLYSIDDDFGVFAGTYAQLLMLQCYDARIPLPQFDDFISVFKKAKFDRGAEVALHDIWEMKRRSEDGCPKVGYGQLENVIDALIANPEFSRKPNIYVLKSLVLGDRGEWNSAASALLEIGPDRMSVSELILSARFFIYAGDPESAEELLARAERNLANPVSRLTYTPQIDSLRGRIVEEFGIE